MDNFPIQTEEPDFASELQSCRDAMQDLSGIACDPDGFGLSELFADAPDLLSDEAFAALVMQKLCGAACPDTGAQSKRFKQLALEVADQIGHDHAQTLYRFAVLVTKLA